MRGELTRWCRDAGSLQDWIDKGFRFSERMLAYIAHDCLQGLQYLHSRRQLHRDIKPAVRVRV